MDDKTHARFAEAVERKKEESRQRSQQHDPTGTVPPADGSGGIEGDEHSIRSDSRSTQDVFSVRAKNSGKGKKTADKWNQ
jgi:hypothetical protein